ELRDELARAQPALDLARTLEKLPQGRYTVEWSPDVRIATVLPCQDARVVAMLLRFDAALRVHGGDADGALQSTHALLNAARSIGDEPEAISQLARISITANTILSLERVLAQGTPSAAALGAFQKLLEDELNEPILLYLARGQRAGQYRSLKGMLDGTVRP